MSDEKPVPCGWCGKEPTYWELGDRHVCTNVDCIAFRGDWNEKQRNILAARRRDFEAGARWAGKLVDERERAADKRGRKP